MEGANAIPALFKSTAEVWSGVAANFKENKVQIELGEKVRRAVISDNVVTGKLRITNRNARPFQINNNATDWRLG